MQLFGEVGGHARLDVDPARGHLADAGQQHVGRRVLQDVARSAPAQGVEQVVDLFEHREHDDPRVGEVARDLLAGHKSVFSGRHGNVEQEHVGLQLRRHPVGFVAVGRRAHHLHVLLRVDDEREALPHDFVVVCNHHAGHARPPSSFDVSGTFNSTVVPSSFDRTVSSPPMMLARSRMPCKPLPCPLICGWLASNPWPWS